ncbi:MFS transporter [Tessaracoccus lubricantis]|uniref:MFS transporter n=1 Tax=Tessaracoccus lubricantis TaxID=545543 RepID=UPI00362511A8
MRAPGMPLILVTAVVAFAGFAVLLPVSPLWAVEGGAAEFGSGMTTTILMATTVLTQLQVNRWLLRWGWTRTLSLGLLALGVPAALQAISPNLWAVLATNAVRGIGFGIISVCGATAVALLTPPEARGRGLGLYGLAVSIPQLALMTVAPLLVDALGLQGTLMLGLLPVAALLWVTPLGRQIERQTAADRASSARRAPLLRVLALMWMPVAALLLVTASGGAMLTFAPQLASETAVAMTILMAVTGLAAVGRWLAGTLSDRFGTKPFIWSLLGIAALGVAAVAAALRSERPAWLIAGAALLGLAYGAIQTVTLVRAFVDAGEENRASASVLWNVGFDVGTGVGAMAIGALAGGFGFPQAFVVTAVTVGVAAVVVAVRGRTS